jgi:hypothetical protein
LCQGQNVTVVVNRPLVYILLVSVCWASSYPVRMSFSYDNDIFGTALHGFSKARITASAIFLKEHDTATSFPARSFYSPRQDSRHNCLQKRRRPKLRHTYVTRKAGNLPLENGRSSSLPRRCSSIYLKNWQKHCRLPLTQQIRETDVMFSERATFRPFKANCSRTAAH